MVADGHGVVAGRQVVGGDVARQPRERVEVVREQAGGDQVQGRVFRKFIMESTEHQEAGEYLEQFEFLFIQLESLNMLPNDYAATRDELLIEILQELELTGLATVAGLGATFIPSEVPGKEAPTV